MSDEVDMPEHRKLIDQLRRPFDPAEVGHLPKLSCAKCRDNQFKVCDQHRRVNPCPECGGSHSSATIHLDYVGHAEVTDRLLEVDPSWSWEPMAITSEGLPALDRNGGMWIKLTVGGITKLGYGDAPGKTGGNAIKETIGDALRNAGMRFGVALDLWRKSERQEADASKSDPDSFLPDGRIIGHGDFRVSRDEWAAKVAHSDQLGRDQGEALLRQLWEQAGDSPDLKSAVTAGIARWKAKHERAAQPESAAQPEQQPADAVSTDDPEVIWTQDYDQAKETSDVATLRKLQTQAQTMRRSDLRKLAAATIADIQEGK